MKEFSLKEDCPEYYKWWEDYNVEETDEFIDCRSYHFLVDERNYVTPKILEENGLHLLYSLIDEEMWCRDDEDCWDHALFSISIRRDKWTIRVENHRSKEKFKFIFDHALDVSELLHTLQLCGLNELVNNFKI